MDNGEENYGKDGPAYFRELIHSNQCELNFMFNTEIPSIGRIKEEIKAVRQASDTISSMLQHIQNKLQKILSDKSTVSDPEQNKDVKTITVSLDRGNKPIKGNMLLKNFPESLKQRENVYLNVGNQEFLVILNAPLVKQMKLPTILFANFTIQPVKFYTLHLDNKQSLFRWYKSMDKVNWEEIGEGFMYKLQDKDVGHYIKLVCTPFNEFQVQGPIVEDVSETTVDRIGELPVCPFTKRHEFTRTRLKGLSFRVVTYNTLADRYTADSENYAYCSPKALAIDYRKQLILNEILGYNADIVCLQEVDNKHYTGYFKEQLKQANYGSLYNRKGNRIPEGLLCIYTKSRYRVLESKHIVLSVEVQRNKVFSNIWNVIKRNEDLKTMFLKQSTSLQVTVLKDKESKKCVIVGNTHLFYHPEADHIRLLQVNMATAYLNMIKRRYLREGTDVSVVFCGDFNSNHDKSLFGYMLQGRISPDHKDCLKIRENGKAVLYHEFIFESACGTPKYTNYTPDYKGCLDYIFIETNKLNVERVVPLTDEEELSKYPGLPNEVFPSDHLALVVDLRFKASSGSIL